MSETDHRAATLDPGTMVDHFRVVRWIARGGMGEVYLARDTQLDRKVALKLVLSEGMVGQRVVERFLHEARTTAKFSHPHIVQVYAVGAYDRRPYVALEYLEGETLRQRLADRPTLDHTIRTSMAIAEALVEAHRHGVLHRDLKPENVIIPTDGRLRVVDFGLAKALPRDQQLVSADTLCADEVDALHATAHAFRSAGGFLGTPLYMAPEQWMDETITGAVDVWALGIMLQEMLTGEHPYEPQLGRGGLAALAAQVCSESPVPIHPPDAEVPSALMEIVRQCLVKRPSDRPTAAAIAVAIRDLAGIDAAAAGRSPSGRGTEQDRDVSVATNLCAETTSFVGRRAELARLHAEIVAGSRLVTVLGPGGTGKTRLARSTGRRLLSSFPGGVWFCDLVDARGVEGICSAVATALDLPLGLRPVEQLPRTIATCGRALFIMDNFEQVAPFASDTVGRWMAQAADAHFLVTSRELLGITGEQTLPLDPLLTPCGDTAGAADIAAFDAVQLFVTRARAVQPSFALTDDNAAAIAEITRQLDGLPLALELAASRSRMLPPERMLERLARRFDLLRSSRRDAADRQATLRATLDWSWELLEPHEQRALAQCAVFQGGFELEAAESVLDLGEDPAVPPVLDVLQALVDKSLVRVGSSAAHDAPSAGPQTQLRFGMLVSVQEYALEKLTTEAAAPAGAAPDEAAAVHERHAEAYARLGEATELLALETDRDASVLDRFVRERDNLWAALVRMGRSGRADLAANCYLALRALLERVGPLPAAVTAYESLQPLTEMSDELRCRVLMAHAAVEVRSGAASAHATAARAVELAERLGRTEWVAIALRWQAHGLYGRMEHRAARDAAERAVGVAEQSGDVGARVEAATVLGFVLQSKATEAIMAAPVALARQGRRFRLLATALSNLAVWTLESRGLAEALRIIEESIAIAESAKATWSVGHGRAMRAIWLNEMNRTEEALDEARAALRVLRPLQLPRSEAIALEALGRCHLARGELNEARTAVEQAVGLCRDLGEEMELVRHLSGKAEVEMARGDRAAALDALEEAEANAVRNPVEPQSNWGRALDRARRVVHGQDEPGAASEVNSAS